jgi:dUTP pyrophosphatase
MDLKACIANPVTIYPRQTAKIMTGVCVFLGVLEESDQCQLAGLYIPRSSARGLVLVNTVGLLDCDYQGESFVKLRNVSDELITVEPGERLVQLIVVPVLTGAWKEVNEFDEITGRGEGGDGSTGRK